ncbi:LAMI_0H19174g1_1 [Lachancea mirantina]|uniref:Kynureninase n=1 Tax=Lachancea mirantina TaxID=1230905 RepID=A0A1G4KK22_9SACH|nr:LAMI_0H19174g1_1 [Lachancea mirantina]
MEEARALDSTYPATKRDAFCIPTFGSMGTKLAPNGSLGDPVTYLCGNSLGCMPRSTRAAINDELDAWAARGVESHFRHSGEDRGLTSWVDIDLPLSKLMSPIVGARDSEVAIMGSLTANLNALLAAFYKPSSSRFKILCEKGAFPSDYYAFYNQCKLHGIDPDSALVRLEPRKGETYLRTEDILKAITANSDSLSIVCLPGIQYYSGQFFEIEKITAHAHSFPGIVVGWDLAHAVGNVPLELHSWNVDFACWCSYKYLNSGPGAIGGIFVHDRHASVAADPLSPDVEAMPRMAGWWGNNRDNRFQMKEVFEPIEGALGFRQSNPSVIDVVALKASLEIFKDFGGMQAIRRRSLLLSNYLLKLLQRSAYYHEKSTDGEGKVGFSIISPLNETERGAQLSLLIQFSKDNPQANTMERVFGYLNDRGVIADERRPDVIRIAPAPLYNTFEDIFTAVKLLNDAFKSL